METNDMESESSVEQILQLIHKPMKKEEFWYLLDKKWFELCKLFIKEKEHIHNPGPIDNSGIITIYYIL